MRDDKLLQQDRCVLLVIDIQEAFVPHIKDIERVIERTCIMIKAARLLEIPIIATEQYPQGLGQTVENVRQAMGDVHYYDKITFSCFQDDKIKQALSSLNRKQLVLTGIEAHVCLAQTACDSLALGCQPYIAVDAVSSRRQMDCDIALQRLRDRGIIVTTTEAAIMELTYSSAHQRFKEISRLIK